MKSYEEHCNNITHEPEKSVWKWARFEYYLNTTVICRREDHPSFGDPTTSGWTRTDYLGDSHGNPISDRKEEKKIDNKSQIDLLEPNTPKFLWENHGIVLTKDNNNLWKLEKIHEPSGTKLITIDKIRDLGVATKLVNALLDTLNGLKKPSPSNPVYEIPES